MSKQLWPIVIQCDAPNYAVVQACRKLVFRTPEDVRWCRWDEFIAPRKRWFDFLVRSARRNRAAGGVAVPDALPFLVQHRGVSSLPAGSVPPLPHGFLEGRHEATTPVTQKGLLAPDARHVGTVSQC